MIPATLTLKLPITRSNMSPVIRLILRLMFSFSLSIVGELVRVQLGK